MYRQRLWSAPTSLLFVLVCTCALAPACNNTPASSAATSEKFFDLDGYMAQEIQRLTERNVRADKTITLNGTTEAQQDITIDYTNDLRLFREADINRPAWVDKYATRQETLSGNHQKTIYTAIDTTLEVQTLMVEKDQGVPIKIEILRKTGTVLSQGRHELRYEPAKGYAVNTQQKNRFAADVVAVIDVRW